MPNKKLHEMLTNPSGSNVFSAMMYCMKHYPGQMAGLYEVYESDPSVLVGWCTGFTYALALIEDNGMPVDVDAVLHSWDYEDKPFDIGEAVKEWMQLNGGEENGNG